MNTSIITERGFYIITLDGDLDASSALQLDTEIKKALEQNEKKIVIDCSKLNYVSSSGLGVFISYLSDFEKDKIYFALLHVKDKIINTLNILGLTKLLNIIEKLPNV
ncbi:MAG: STAS domain-containing protein [Cytophagales bacterium]